MDIESIRDYCLSLPLATEDMAFGPDCLLIRVCGKIFAFYAFSRPDYLVLKADPDLTLDLRDRYPEVEPAWHWNKKYWNQIIIRNNLSDEFIRSLIRHSYSEVVKKLPRHTLTQHPEIARVLSDIV